ncbi:MAG TPA: hypothetical protein VGD22_17365 [Sphingobacteriaceae bacterium]
MRKVLLSGVLLVCFIATSFAAEVDGLWKGYVEGQYNMSLTLKSEADKITGTLAIVDNNPKSENPEDTQYSPYVAAQLGKNVISDVKIEADTITFTCLFNGKPINYKGTIQGEKLILTTNFNGQNVKATLTKAKAK